MRVFILVSDWLNWIVKLEPSEAWTGAQNETNVALYTSDWVVKLVYCNTFEACVTLFACDLPPPTITIPLIISTWVIFGDLVEIHTYKRISGNGPSIIHNLKLINWFMEETWIWTKQKSNWFSKELSLRKLKAESLILPYKYSLKILRNKMLAIPASGIKPLMIALWCHNNFCLLVVMSSIYEHHYCDIICSWRVTW